MAHGLQLGHGGSPDGGAVFGAPRCARRPAVRQYAALGGPDFPAQGRGVEDQQRINFADGEGFGIDIDDQVQKLPAPGGQLGGKGIHVGIGRFVVGTGMAGQKALPHHRALLIDHRIGHRRRPVQFDQLADATGTLFDHVNMTAGMRVLDLACGAGSQTLMAAQRVSQSGRVVACDISDEILKHTRENADRAGLSNIEIRRSASEDLSGEGEQFDAAYSRLGLMLFASPSTALAALQGVLKPGGRFAALVFSTSDRNPYQVEPMKILLRHSGAPPPRPGQPGIFALAAPAYWKTFCAKRLRRHRNGNCADALTSYVRRRCPCLHAAGRRRLPRGCRGFERGGKSGGLGGGQGGS